MQIILLPQSAIKLNIVNYNIMKMKTQILIFCSFFLLQNSFAQTFVEQTGISLTGVLSSSVAWGDYNNDGFLDILLTGNTGVNDVSKIYKNNGNGTFTEQTTISLSGVSGSSVAWGDYNNDGFLDILLTGSGISKIYKNNGNGTFTERPEISLPGVSGSSVAWGDYNNDGFLDILLTGTIGSTPSSRVYRNNGNGNFTHHLSFPMAGVTGSSVAWGDYNNDGFLDFLLTGFNGRYHFSKIYRNNGNESFTERTEISLPGVSGSSVAWGDYDNDGFLDILLTGSDDNSKYAKIYRNNGSGNFIEQTSISLEGVRFGSVAWGDYNNDGFLDILLTGNTWYSNTNVSKIYKNNGNGTFTEQTVNQGISLPGVSRSSVAWGDFNNDGFLDILLTGSVGVTGVASISRIYKYVSFAQPNTSPQVPTNLQYNTGLKKLSWNRASDNQTPSKSLSYNLAIGTIDNPNGYKSPHSNLTNGLRRIVSMGNTQLDTFYLINNLPFDSICYARLQAIDNGYMASGFSTAIQLPPFPPIGSIANNDTVVVCGTSVQLGVAISNGNPSNLVYSWSPSSGLINSNKSNPIARPTQTTWYKVTATASSSLSFTDSILITVSPMKVNTGKDLTIICGQNSILDPTNNYSGLQSNLSYLWSPSNSLDTSTKKNPIVKPISTTNYILELTSIEGCRAADTVKVIVNSLEITSANLIKTCGDSTLAGNTINSNSANLTYSWKPTIGISNANILNPYIMPIYSNTYYLLATDGGCTAIDTIEVRVNKKDFNPSFTANQTLFTAPPFIVQFSNTTSNQNNYNFKWTFGDSIEINSNNLSVFHEYNFNGLYDVSVIAIDKITACPDTLVREGYIYCIGGKNTGVAHYNIDDEISLFPNPTSDRINIKVPANYIGKEYVVIDNIGRVRLSDNFKSTDQQINVQNLNDGIYLLKICDESEVLIKFIKQ